MKVLLVPKSRAKKYNADIIIRIPGEEPFIDPALISRGIELHLKEQPDYVILLAWHYAESIMEQLKSRGLKSTFVIPLPDLKIVT